MSRWRIDYSAQYQPSPLSFWVHRHLDGDSWLSATHYEPSLPNPIPAKGFPVVIIDAFCTDLRFSSVEEIEHFLNVIGRKNLPTPTHLANQRNTTYGPNAHWLSRLPADLKPWRKREKLVPILRAALNELKTVYQQPSSAIDPS